MVNEKRLLDTFLEYIKIDSESKNEKAMGEKLVADLKALGLFLSDRECCMCSLSFDIFSQGRFQIPLSIQIHRIDRHHRF